MNHISTDIYKNNLDHLLNIKFLYYTIDQNNQLSENENDKMTR